MTQLSEDLGTEATETEKERPQDYLLHKTKGEGEELGLRTYGIPDLELERFVVNRDHPRPEFHADGQVVHGLESLVREL